MNEDQYTRTKATTAVYFAIAVLLLGATAAALYFYVQNNGGSETVLSDAEKYKILGQMAQSATPIISDSDKMKLLESLKKQ